MRYDVSVLGERIRQERERLGLSRERFSELIGISSSFLGLVERGDRKLSLEKICLVAEIFNMPIDKFLMRSTLSHEEKCNGDINNNDRLEVEAVLSTCSDKELRYLRENIQLIKRLCLFE